MRIVGTRKEFSISFSARADLLIDGARFNDEIHRLPGGQITCIPKGAYRFKTHAEANRQQEECIIAGMIQLARERVK
jgi:hypothetical protein